MAISDVLTEAGRLARGELNTPVEVIDTETFPEPSEMYSEARKWMRLEDVVALVVDLKGSTKLDYKGQHANTSARLYEAVTGGGVKLAMEFEPEFVDIQGDGFFALFHGEVAYERALCAGVSLKTFSEDQLVPAIEGKMGDRFPKTGLKVGLAASTLVVKRVGTRKTKEPIWAGRAVNWATKCAQRADRHELIATSKVFKHFESNGYVTHSCGCGDGVPKPLWTPTSVGTLPDHETQCHLLRTKWCEKCGDAFCEKIRSGARDRDLTTVGASSGL